MSISSIGPIVSRQNVEQAYLATIIEWLSTYLSEVEAQNSLAPLPLPPSPASFYGGVDEQTFTEDDLPAVVVIAQPVEDAIRFGDGSYAQWFEVTVSPIVATETEDDSRALAGWYAAAVATMLTQQSDLGGFAQATIPIDPGRAEFVNEDVRRFAQAPATFHTFVYSTASAAGRPTAPGYPPSPVPTVTTTTGAGVIVTLEAVPAAVPVRTPPTAPDTDTITVT